ncbi:cytospin-A-like isoform X2 [Paramormyrops kingsleyae]|uniref:cytospin-A-like isoform X2 n=1 Tax=Paramormyrops kingsleyae TaxID=1676925 RepID=UPI000CD67313|nr:cytospin-A-like isoform X2 [Paramormyrops kingsleyae]
MCSPRKATASGVRLLCKCVSNREPGMRTTQRAVVSAAGGVGVRSSAAPVALAGGALLQGTSAARGKKSLYANVALVVPGTANPQDKANGCSSVGRSWVSSIVKDPGLSQRNLRPRVQNSKKPLTATAGSANDGRIPKLRGAWVRPAAHKEGERSIRAAHGEPSPLCVAGPDVQNQMDVLRADKEQAEGVAATLKEELRHAHDEVTRLGHTLGKLQGEFELHQEEAQKHAALQQAELEDREVRIANMEESIFVLEDEVEQHRAVKLHDNLTISDLESYVEKLEGQNHNLQREIKLLQRRHQEEAAQWRQFQADLQTAVVVANRVREQVEGELGTLQRRLREAQERNEGQGKELEEARRRGKDQLHSYINVAQSDMARRHQVERPVPSSSSSCSPSPTISALIRTFHLPPQAPTQDVDTVAMPMARPPLSPRLLRSPRAAVVPPVQNSCASCPPSLQLRMDRRLSESVSHGSSEEATTEGSCPSAILRSPSSPSPPRPEPCSEMTARGSPRDQVLYPLRALVRENGESKRNALLRWCQRKTQGYQNINIKNFSSSWKDGLALCAILHAFLPGHIPFQELNGQDKRRNLILAVRAAESVGIKCTLDIDEMEWMERPDWQRVMSYISTIYEHFEN